jgi:hypothetical protein
VGERTDVAVRNPCLIVEFNVLPRMLMGAGKIAEMKAGGAGGAFVPRRNGAEARNRRAFPARSHGPVGLSRGCGRAPHLRADSENEVDERLKADPWTRSGILSTSRIARWNLGLGEVG